MKKTILIILLFTIIIFGSDGIIFKVRVHPSRVYKIRTDLEIKGLIDYVAEKEILDGIKAKGIQFPMETYAKKDYLTIIETNAPKPDGTFNFTTSFDDVKYMQVINGVEIDKTENQFINEDVELEGYYSIDGKMNLNTIEGKSLSDEMKKTLRQVFASNQVNVEFPDYPLQIGDTFTQETPISIPVNGMSAKIVSKVEYKLVDITDEDAVFLTESTYKMVSNTNNNNKVIVSGGGKGKVIFDLDETYMISYASENDMNMEIEAENLKIISKNTTKSSVTTEILHN